MSDQDFLDVLEGHFHIDGPHDRDRVIEASQCAAALIHYLNHATLPGPRAERTLEWASTVNSVVGDLSAVAHGQRQLLDQLRQGLYAQIGNPTLYDDRRDDVHHAGDTATSAAVLLGQVAMKATELGDELDRVHKYTGHLGNR